MLCMYHTYARRQRSPRFLGSRRLGLRSAFSSSSSLFYLLIATPQQSGYCSFPRSQVRLLCKRGVKIATSSFFFFLAYNNIRSAGGVCCCVHISYIHTYYGGAFSCLFILICLICDVFLSVHVFVVCAFFMNECVSVFFSFIERVGPPLFFCGVLRCLQSSYIVMALGFSWLRVIYCGCCKS